MAKIVLVEDDPMISEIYQKKFKEAGFEVFPAESGEQALTLVEKGMADVVLLDLVLPRMSGFDVIKNIRKSEHREDVRIIVFTNSNQPEDQSKAMELGADGFVVKADFTPSNLVKEIQRHINQFEEQKKNGKREEEKNENLSGKKKILLIEDEQVFLDMFGEKLRQDGFEVVTAANGAWGMKEAAKEDFDLFIIDMVMPAMTGDEIVARLKLEEKTKNVPIIILSASVDDDAKKKIEGMGVDAFFVKTQLIPSDLSKKAEELIK